VLSSEFSVLMHFGSFLISAFLVFATAANASGGSRLNLPQSSAELTLNADDLRSILAPQNISRRQWNVRVGCFSVKIRTLFLLLWGVSAIAGCTGSSQPERLSEEACRAKMRLVIDETIRQTQDPAEKDAFSSGKIFVNIEGLNVQVVGVTVPSEKTKIHVSFMTDYFQTKDVPILATEALQDFRRATHVQPTKH